MMQHDNDNDNDNNTKNQERYGSKNETIFDYDNEDVDENHYMSTSVLIVRYVIVFMIFLSLLSTCVILLLHHFTTWGAIAGLLAWTVVLNLDNNRYDNIE